VSRCAPQLLSIPLACEMYALLQVVAAGYHCMQLDSTVDKPPQLVRGAGPPCCDGEHYTRLGDNCQRGGAEHGVLVAVLQEQVAVAASANAEGRLGSAGTYTCMRT
jgi:hypothetical protein